MANQTCFVVNINEDGTLGTPENLTKAINTEGQETFPFINAIGDLYFSTNGYPGLGGLDIYVIKDFENKKETNQDLVASNIGKPINSSQDDFGYFENINTKSGFFTSNRPNGKGDDDIYSFITILCEQTVEGLVKDKVSLELLSESTVTIYDENGEKIESVIVGKDAFFKFQLDCEKEYLVRAEKEGYIPDEKRFTTPNIKQELKLELLLEKDEHEISTLC